MPELLSKPAHSVPHNESIFEQLLDSDEAAALLKIHPKTLQKMARTGEISGVQIGEGLHEHLVGWRSASLKLQENIVWSPSRNIKASCPYWMATRATR